MSDHHPDCSGRADHTGMCACGALIDGHVRPFPTPQVVAEEGLCGVVAAFRFQNVGHLAEFRREHVERPCPDIDPFVELEEVPLVAVAPDIAAAAVREALAPLVDGTGREGPADADDPAALLTREVRRQCAEEHLSAIEYLLSAYPADVFPPDGQSRDAIAGTALRTVLTANLKHWRSEWSA